MVMMFDATVNWVRSRPRPVFQPYAYVTMIIIGNNLGTEAYLVQPPTGSPSESHPIVSDLTTLPSLTH
jgi:hypothetical protein